jgi:hypothetical protein
MVRLSGTYFFGWIGILFLFATQVYSQPVQIEADNYSKLLKTRQQKALSLLGKEDTLSESPFWPNIKPAYFFANIRANIERPDKINQGQSTNFCAYAAITHLLARYQPELYLEHILALYRTGKTTVGKKLLNPSPSVRAATGTLKNKGELDILDADQLWFLTLADCFKGYINFFDRKYNRGDENRLWAVATFGKFNRMVKAFTASEIITVGSDLIRPMKGNIHDYISSQLPKGVILMYVNSKQLYPHKFSVFTLRAPTHFVVLYNMTKLNGMTEIKYLDYGLKTEQLITSKRLEKMVFGVTTITNPK